MSEITVKDWMHPDIITCRPDTPIDEVAKTMDAKDISALVAYTHKLDYETFAVLDDHPRHHRHYSLHKRLP
jgi:CBS-domain-containing membrane protein